MPRAFAIGARIGTRIMSAAFVSMNMPMTRKNTLSMSRMTILFSVKAKIMFMNRVGSCVRVSR